MKRIPRRISTAEFKREAIKLVTEQGLTLAMPAENWTLPLNHYAFDITYIPTDEGWLFRAVIKDLHACEIVGWAMGSRMTEVLAVDALRAAYWRNKPEPGLAHHLTVEASIAAAHTVHYKSAVA